MESVSIFYNILRGGERKVGLISVSMIGPMLFLATAIRQIYTLINILIKSEISQVGWVIFSVYQNLAQEK